MMLPKQKTMCETLQNRCDVSLRDWNMRSYKSISYLGGIAPKVENGNSSALDVLFGKNIAIGVIYGEVNLRFSKRGYHCQRGLLMIK